MTRPRAPTLDSPPTPSSSASVSPRTWVRAAGVIACLAPAFSAPAVRGPGARIGVGVEHCFVRPALYRIDLAPTERVPGAVGVAWLRPPRSAFGVSVTEDGAFVYDVDVTVRGLPKPAALGPYTAYVAWVATPDLDQVNRLDAVGADQRAVGRVAWNKFVVFVTAEAAPAGQHWTGPIVLRGMSASGYLQNFSSHPLFSGGVPPC